MVQISQQNGCLVSLEHTLPPTDKLPRCPSGLKTSGKNVFRRITTALHDVRALAETDCIYIELVARCFDLLDEINIKIDEAGIAYEEDGLLKKHPLLVTKVQLLDKIESYLKNCAATPVHHNQIRPLVLETRKARESIHKIEDHIRKRHTG